MDRANVDERAQGKPRTHGGLRQNGFAFRALSTLSLFGAWLLLSAVMSSDVVPGPVETIAFLVRELESGSLLFHLWATTRRVAVAFIAAMAAGLALGVLMGSNRRLDTLLEAWLVAGLTIPRIVLFVVAYLLLGLNDTAAIVALFLTVVPIVVVQLREGTKALDPKLIEMARAYRRPPGLVWRKVVFPQLLPYFIGTARGALSLSWKMVVLAELLGRTSGIGYQITFYFSLFNMKGVLAYGLTMMIVLAAIDLAFAAAMHRSASRWRQPVSLAG